MNTELKFLNALNSIPGVGTATLRYLKNNLGSFEAAWRASETELEKACSGQTALRSILWKRPSLNPDREMGKLVKENIWMIAEEDSHYPPLLKEIPHPPLMLYGKGNIENLAKSEKNLAVVGTRRPTQYGLEVTENLVHELVSHGLNIVSGLATGIDTRAHEATLDSKGVTIAVLGSGLDQNSIFPPENRGLLRRITEAGGTVISEYAPETPAFKEHFPQRNRIISGLSRGVLVVEAREKSGALITARFALEQNREVFAVPGPVFSNTSSGPNKLIQQGAKLVTSAEDILNELGIEYNEKTRQERGPLEEQEKILLGILEEPLAIDFIKQKTGMETPAIVASLSMLELKGLVRCLGGETYQRISNF